MNLREKLIRVLGGMLWSDIHPIDQVAILQRKADTVRDMQIAKALWLGEKITKTRYSA